MKRITKVLGTSIVAAALSLSVQANLLTDPGFESGAPGQPNPIPVPAGANGGWAVFNGATFSTAAAETGTWGISESEGVGANWNFEAPYQVSAGASAGAVYTLTADFKTPTGITETSPSWLPAIIQLTFFNAAGADLGTVETGGVGANAIHYMPTASWQTATVSATAPAGAVYISSYLAMQENASNTGVDVIYWDNANLVPEPTILALLTLALPAYLLRRKIG